MEASEITNLTAEQKDQLILSQAQRIEKLEAKIEGLENRLSKNSSNSSKPPSSDGFNKPNPKSRRNKNKKKKKVGGQKGHIGKTLNQIPDPDFIEEYDPSHCWQCVHSLANEDRLTYESRQVFDLPPLDLDVTEHRAYKKCCRHCGATTKGQFPTEVTQPTQYGPKVKGLMIYMNQYQLLPFEREREFFFDIFKQSMSVGTIKAAIKSGFNHLAPAENHIKQQLIDASVLHSDETGFRVNKQSYWLHVNSTARLTFYAAHEKRGRIAMNDIGLLPAFKGKLVHDHLKSYFKFGASHSLCNAHHLRELTFVQERYQHQWAEKMETLLVQIKNAVEAHYADTCEPLPPDRLKRYRRRYMNILSQGRKECPHNTENSSGKRGRIKQTKARNLLDRLRQFNESTLAFMYDPEVPFDNNQAERDIRMMKVQQKISGCFRTTTGVNHFCRIRGYISTAKKQGVSVMHALQKAIQNQPIMFTA